MHEAAIAQSLLDVLLSESEKHGAPRITGVLVQVGELSGVVPEALEFALQALAMETRAEGLALHIDKVPLRVRCRECDAECGADPWLLCCRECGTGEIEIVSGRELKVISMDVED